jgi:1L-myo-inositol 1-phosphate cytidylyltransferase / CDP-L-myo-inositol myo-inositolphosphotransferase
MFLVSCRSPARQVLALTPDIGHLVLAGFISIRGTPPIALRFAMHKGESIEMRVHPSSCLILAAGTGQRMKSFKPLVKVAGLPLIERVIATAHEAGLSDFFVVTGNQAERLEAFLADLGRRRGLRITCIRNPQWQAENGVSLLQAKDLLAEDDFVLLMGDHIVEERIIQTVLDEPLQDCDVALAVDSGVGENPIVDPDDVTRVLVNSGRVESIAKGLENYNAFDTGVFRCSPAVFAAAQACVEEDKGSLSDAIRYLARRGRVKAVDVRGSFWVDADRPIDARRAETGLYRRLGKPRDGFISVKLNRRLSTRFLTPLLLRLRGDLTPNQVSLAGLAVSLLACASFVLSAAWLGGVLIHLASVLDGSDGEVARLKKLQTRFGGFFDAVLDRYGDGFILFGMFYYAYTNAAIGGLLGFAAPPLILTASFLALAGNFMVSYTSSKSVTDLGYEYTGGWFASGRGRDLRLFILSVGGLASVLHPVAVIIALGLVGALVSAIVVRRTWLSWEHARGLSPFVDRPLRAVVLDFDGTVADTMTYLSELAVGLISSHYDRPPTAALKGYLATTGMDFASQLETMFPQHAANAMVAAAMEEKKRCGLVDKSVFRDVKPALSSLKDQGILAFICSSTSHEIVREFVQRTGIESLVDGVYGYSAGLPKDRQIKVILNDHRLDAAEVILVGDSFADQEFARSAGIRFIGLTRMFTAEEFRQHAIVNVADLGELSRLLERWAKAIGFVQARAPEAVETLPLAAPPERVPG